jgi:HEAT repeats
MRCGLATVSEGSTKKRRFLLVACVLLGCPAVAAILVAATLWFSVRDIRAELEMCELTGVVPARREAIDRLGGQHKTMSRLMKYLDLPEWCAPNKGMAVFVLAECGPEAERSISGLLLHPCLDVKSAAAELVYEKGLPCETGLAYSVMADSRNPSRVRGTLLLVLVGKGAEAVPFLADGMRHVDDDVRACSAYILGQIGSERARELLEGSVGDKNATVRNAVQRALERIKKPQEG